MRTAFSIVAAYHYRIEIRAVIVNRSAKPALINIDR